MTASMTAPMTDKVALVTGAASPVACSRNRSPLKPRRKHPLQLGHPGMIDTDFFHATATALPEIASAIRAKIPMGRLGRAQEVASCILFLASDEASYVTGMEFVVDGGHTAL